MNAYFKDIWRCRYFWLSLVRVDLRQRYRGSVVGIGWSLLHPVGMTVILCVVFATLFHQNVRTFAPYVMAGLTFWQFVLTVCTEGCDCFFRAEAYIRQYPAPMAIYPLRTMLGRGFHFVSGYLLVIVLGLICHGSLDPLTLLTVAPTFVLLTAFGWSLALLFGLAHVRFRDTKHISEIAFQMLYFMTPVMYPAELLQKTYLRYLIYLNPLTPFLELLRQPVCPPAPGQPDFPWATVYAAAALITLATMAFAGAAMRTQERRVIFHL